MFHFITPSPSPLHHKPPPLCLLARRVPQSKEGPGPNHSENTSFKKATAKTQFKLGNNWAAKAPGTHKTTEAKRAKVKEWQDKQRAEGLILLKNKWLPPPSPRSPPSPQKRAAAAPKNAGAAKKAPRS
jgi:hypothetical protein